MKIKINKNAQDGNQSVGRGALMGAGKGALGGAAFGGLLGGMSGGSGAKPILRGSAAGAISMALLNAARGAYNNIPGRGNTGRLYKEEVAGVARAMKERADGKKSNMFRPGDIDMALEKERNRDPYRGALKPALMGAGIGGGLGIVAGGALPAYMGERNPKTLLASALLGGLSLAAGGAATGVTAKSLVNQKKNYENSVDLMDNMLAEKGITRGEGEKLLAKWNYTPEAEAKYLAPYDKRTKTAGAANVFSSIGRGLKSYKSNLLGTGLSKSTALADRINKSMGVASEMGDISRMNRLSGHLGKVTDLANKQRNAMNITRAATGAAAGGMALGGVAMSRPKTASIVESLIDSAYGNNTQEKTAGAANVFSSIGRGLRTYKSNMLGTGLKKSTALLQKINKTKAAPGDISRYYQLSDRLSKVTDIANKQRYAMNITRATTGAAAGGMALGGVAMSRPKTASVIETLYASAYGE